MAVVSIANIVAPRPRRLNSKLDVISFRSETIRHRNCHADGIIIRLRYAPYGGISYIRHLRPRFVAVGGLLTGQHAPDLIARYGNSCRLNRATTRAVTVTQSHFIRVNLFDGFDDIWIGRQPALYCGL